MTDQLHPDLLERVNRVLAAMAALGYPMRICQGVRSVEQQQALYAQGRTTPGPIVTNCDGVKERSNHQAGPDGYGRAVDCCFVGRAPFVGPFEVYGAAGMALGLRWGGKFTTMVDRPHLELPPVSPPIPPSTPRASIPHGVPAL